MREPVLRPGAQGAIDGGLGPLGLTGILVACRQLEVGLEVEADEENALAPRDRRETLRRAETGSPRHGPGSVGRGLDVSQTTPTPKR